jgi:carnitine-CoA ligase
VPSLPCPARPLPEPGDPIPAAAVKPGDTLAILYTSGTTGPSKGVCCPHAQYFWYGANSAAILRVGADDVLCTSLPLFHINALNSFAQALLTGARQVVEGRFSVSGFWTSLARHEATVTYLLGAMVPMLLSREPSPAERAHKVRTALGPGVPAHLFETFRARTGIALVEGYGSTETNFVIASVGTDKPGGMGVLRPGFEARIVDENDTELPPGSPGELVLRADEPFAFSTGYLGMPEQTVEAWRNLWFHTGDRVVRDADGRFHFVDRLKDAIRRRGENISSFEVEQVLLSHPAVATAAVFPVRSELAEDEVMAAIVVKPGESLTGEALVRFCEPRLPAFAVPRFVEVLPDLPRTENGKVQKYRLRERGVSPTTWDREAAGIVLDRRAGRAPPAS